MRRLRLLEPWRSRLLWASLALNLFAATMLAAPLLRHRRPPGPPDFTATMERLANRLEPGDAQRFRRMMDAERPAYETGRAHVEAARRELAAQLVRQPYDPAAVRAALDEMQRSIQEMGGRFNDTLASAVAGMSPGSRAEVARFMDRRPR